MVDIIKLAISHGLISEDNGSIINTISDLGGEDLPPYAAGPKVKKLLKRLRKWSRKNAKRRAYNRIINLSPTVPDGRDDEDEDYDGLPDIGGGRT